MAVEFRSDLSTALTKLYSILISLPAACSPRSNAQLFPQRVQIAGIPIKLSKTPGKVVRRGPRQGEHTDEVLKEAGFSLGEISAWRRDGVVK